MKTAHLAWRSRAALGRNVALLKAVKLRHVTDTYNFPTNSNRLNRTYRAVPEGGRCSGISGNRQEQHWYDGILHRGFIWNYSPARCGVSLARSNLWRLRLRPGSTEAYGLAI